jgi:hypothetical protein
MSWFFEEEEKPSIPPQVVRKTSASGRVSIETSDYNSNPTYEKLRSKINFDSTETGVVFNKYLNPLASLPIKDEDKFKAAMAQAKAQEGLTVEKILATFDGLQVRLTQENENFKEALSSQKTALDEKTKQRDEIQRQLNALNAEVEQLTTRCTTAQGKFDAAVNQLSSFLTTQKENFAKLLKG